MFLHVGEVTTEPVKLQIVFKVYANCRVIFEMILAVCKSSENSSKNNMELGKCLDPVLS